MVLKTERIQSLDILRGFAILTMILSGVVPYRTLPAWMYHAQIPPPNRIFSPELAGITWVDLVFPLFIFCMGAAIPLALQKRVDRNENLGSISWSIIQRTFFLGSFAILLHHLRPHQIESQPSATTWVLALCGFVLLFFAYARWPQKWQGVWTMWLKSIGWIGLVIMVGLLSYKDDSRFSLYRSDIILLVLTNLYFFGSFIWYFTKQHKYSRFFIMGILLAFRVSHEMSPWSQNIWDFSPFPWLYKFSYLQYLLILIPGLFAGEYLLKTSSKMSSLASSWKNQSILLALICFVVLIVILTGLYNRWVWQSGLAAISILFITYYFVYNSTWLHPLKPYFLFGIALIILGYLFEPFEGGIKKDPSTISYYFITGGMSFIFLSALLIIEHLIKNNWLMKLLSDNGKNPMIAYVGFANVIWPILALTGLETIINNLTENPWIGFLRALVYTILLAMGVAYITRKRIYWKT